MIVAILTLTLGIIGGAAADRCLQHRRRRRTALEEIEIVLSQVQRYCRKLNGDTVATNPETFPYDKLDMKEDEATNIVKRLQTTADNLERHAFEATKILRKYPSLPYRSEIIEALYGEDFPTIEERAQRIAKIRGDIHDEIEAYTFDKGGELLQEIDEYRPGGHVSMEDIRNPVTPPSPSLTEMGLRSYISTARFGLGEILGRQQSDN